jgi:glycosyltransferase involved in cell wall biosynthesis
MTSWLLIAGDFVPLGGMDRANYALALHLAGRDAPGRTVHVVAHRVWPDLEGSTAVTLHRVRRPLGSHLLGAPLLAAEAERRAHGFSGRVIANGGNADTGDVTWVHYVHAAHAPEHAGIAGHIRGRLVHRYYLTRERRALRRARVVVCNSRRTAEDVRDRVGVPAERTRVVYYGTDPVAFARVTTDERNAARAALGWPLDRPVVLFVGALGDRRKGFDRLFDAWRQLCGDASWDADLAVAGHGRELVKWQRRACDSRLASRIRFLGFRDDIDRVIAASDVLVHPARYEAYGLGVHEAICRGLPAIVAASAGVAELYPAELHDLLIRDVEDSTEIADRIHRWRWDVDAAASRIRGFSDRLRSRTWRDMSVDIERTVTA